MNYLLILWKNKIKIPPSLVTKIIHSLLESLTDMIYLYRPFGMVV